MSVTAELGYLKRGCAHPHEYAFPPPGGGPWHNCDYEPRAMSVADARTAPSPPSVHREGFELRDAPSAIDFDDERDIVAVYYREMADLACEVTGAARACVFDHLVRRREAGRPALSFGRSSAGSVAANGRVHNDYTEDSGRKRLGMVLQEPSSLAGVERYGIVNIWRTIRGPVLDTPLAVLDARTVEAADLIAGEVHYPKRTGAIYFVTHSPRHRWAYYPAMDRHEALVFKQYDSRLSGVARFTPHAAFVLPRPPAGVPLRESIEIRCLVVYE